MANSDLVLATCTRLVTPPANACRCAGDPTCCPGEAEIVSEHAPLIMLTATADALLDEGVSYASKLEEAGGWPNKFAADAVTIATAMYLKSCRSRARRNRCYVDRWARQSLRRG